MKLSEFISNNDKTILLDGAMGTQLDEANLKMGGQTNLSHHSLIISLSVFLTSVSCLSILVVLKRLESVMHNAPPNLTRMSK